MAAIGRESFQGVFQSNDDDLDLWVALRTNQRDARVEIVTGIGEATTLPWELMRNARTDVPLAAGE